MATPYSLQVYDEVTSTQDIAAAALVDDPVLVVSGRQTEGRGQEPANLGIGAAGDGGESRVSPGLGTLTLGR